jgi:hypothetical protein
VTLVAILAALSVCSAATSQTGASRYPDSIAVLGHSGSTGEDSDPRRPHEEVRANSWATGTNPRVNSLYLRILAKNPGIKGHNFGLSQGGATVRELLRQAQRAVAMQPKPELMVVQIMDNDMVCPATASDYAQFRAGVIAALKVLAERAPESLIFVVSQFGSPATSAKAMSPSQRLRLAGSGPCDFINLTGKIVPTKVPRLDRVIHAYEAQLAGACKQFPRCRYDGGAFGRIVDRRVYMSEDLNHFSVRGHAKAAAVAWAALQRVGFVPR